MNSPYAEHEPRAPKSIADMLASHTPKVKALPKGIHSELHEVIAKMRKDFGETATKGVGSFGFYLGLLKNVPLTNIYRWLADAEGRPSINTPTKKAKNFWWKYKTWKTGDKSVARVAG